MARLKLRRVPVSDCVVGPTVKQVLSRHCRVLAWGEAARLGRIAGRASSADHRFNLCHLVHQQGFCSLMRTGKWKKSERSDITEIIFEERCDCVLLTRRASSTRAAASRLPSDEASWNASPRSTTRPSAAYSAASTSYSASPSKSVRLTVRWAQIFPGTGARAGLTQPVICTCFVYTVHSTHVSRQARPLAQPLLRHTVQTAAPRRISALACGCAAVLSLTPARPVWLLRVLWSGTAGCNR